MRAFLFLWVCSQTVAGFDRQIAGATHKCWLKRRLSGWTEAIFVNDCGERFMYSNTLLLMRRHR